MICLTGDVHQNSLNTTDQRCTSIHTAFIAEEYLRIVSDYNIKVTLFVTGKFCEELPTENKNLLLSDNLEVGGHTWNAFRPRWLHALFRKFLGTAYGPYVCQQFDVRRTLRTIKGCIGQFPSAWRTHGYGSDNNTVDILARAGVRLISDDVNDKKILPERLTNGMISLPINVLPDHEHLYHGYRDEQLVQSYLNKGHGYAVTNKSYYIDEYFEIIKSQIEFIEGQGGIATLLLHPICMKITDNFEMFTKLLSWIKSKKYNSIWCSDVIDLIDH